MSDLKPGPVILDLAGIEVLPEEKEVLRHAQVGGVILFTRNFECPDQLGDLVKQIREARPQLLVTVDHEGGRVQRFKEGFTRLPPMQCFRALEEGAQQMATELGWLMAAELIAFDIDLSFAPVLDLDDSHSDIIGNRSFSPDPEEAIVLAESFIVGMKAAGMSVTGKHFPGHGGVKEDSHLTLPIDERPLSLLESHDLLPFARLNDKLDALMSAHMVFPDVDEQLVSFSSIWLQDYLRGKLGFEGLVFSDDLAMEGAASAGSYSARAQRALDAGCDVVLVCNQPQHAIEVIQSLETEQRPMSSRSVASLKKSQSFTLEELQSSSRWLQARDFIETLN